MTTLVAASLFACSADQAIEDEANDVFLTNAAKADAFGVEDWSPDGAAVLRLVSTASVTKLDDEVGLSSRVARNIVAMRSTLPNNTFADLADLDAVPYVGRAVFTHLLEYVTEHKLFRTALRIPLVIDDGVGNKTLLTSFNDEATSAGHQRFARYTFVNSTTDYGAKANSYDQRLQALAAAGIAIEGELVRYASSLGDYGVGSTKVCFIGDPDEVPGVTRADELMGDMYSQWGWRYKTKQWTYDNLSANEANLEFGDVWKDWDTSSDSLLIMSTNDDSGDNPAPDVIAPCR